MLLLLLNGVVSSLAPAGAPPDLASFWERFHMDANGRLRWESTFDQPNGEDRHRGRIRARVGARYDLMEDLTVNARLTTSSDGNDANNPHWDFGDGSDGFRGGDVLFDRFYLDWVPTDHVDVRAGKLPHVLKGPPVYGEFVWDNDVQPAGATVVLEHELNERTRGDLRLAQYVAVESSTEDDPRMFGVQGNLDVDVGDRVGVHGAAGYMLWTELDAGAGVFDQGNTDFTEDFGILDLWVSADLETESVGTGTAFFEYMNNTEDDTGEDTGYAAGLKLGNSGSKGDVNAFGAWYDLDANAVFSPVAQDDTPIAGTGTGEGMTGVIAGVQYFWSDQVAIKLWVLTSDADAADDPYRVRLDLDFTVK